MAMAELYSESECINTNTTMCVDGIPYTCCGRMGYYCQTDLSSSPFWIGTLIYVILGVIGCAVGGLGFGRNNAKLGIYLACVATVCLWIPYVFILFVVKYYVILFVYIECRNIAC